MAREKPAVRFTTMFDVADRFIGTEEYAGSLDNPAVMAMLKLDNRWPKGDSVPWCSAFVNYIAWLLRLPRSKSLAARSWLEVGSVVELEEAIPRGNDVCILWRGRKAGKSGHVGIYAGREGSHVWILGGNQGDKVSLARYPASRLLGIRRLL